MSFPHSHAFLNGGPRMIWDLHSSSMEEPNVDEKERAMGFRTSTIVVQGFSKEFVGGLWISTTSHGFLTWYWQNSYVLANHTH